MAPCFFSATVYGLLGTVIRSVGRRYSLLPSQAYLWIFCLADLVAIVVQAVGGALSATALADDRSSTPGSRIMLGGIVLQLACMLVFAWLAAVVWLRMRRDRSYRETPHPQAGKLTPLGWGIAIATVTIVIRGIYRSAELAEGWGGYLLRASSTLWSNNSIVSLLGVIGRLMSNPHAGHEPYFCVLDSALMVICQGVFCFVWPNREGRAAAALIETVETCPTSSRTVLGQWKGHAQDQSDLSLQKAEAQP